MQMKAASRRLFDHPGRGLFRRGQMQARPLGKQPGFHISPTTTDDSDTDSDLSQIGIVQTGRLRRFK